jgi:hypothetical protein
MSHFDAPQSEDEEPKESRSKEEESKPKSYPFCYRVEFFKPVIMLLRSSLSEEKLVSEAENLLIANYVEAGKEAPSNKNFFYDASRENFQQDFFESCIQIREQEIQFHSFAQAEEESDEDERSEIHINLLNFYIYNFQDTNTNAIVFSPEIAVTLVDKHLSASLKTMNTNFTADEYRLLIRITEENFAEAPVSYPKDAVETEEKNVGFKSSYTIEELSMVLREEMGSEKFGELKISNVIGTNILYTNGEKEDLITVEKLEYESCLNNSLERIIVKKEEVASLFHGSH